MSNRVFLIFCVIGFIFSECILASEIKLLKPQSGELYRTGTECTIAWESTDLRGQIQIDLYKSGTFFANIAKANVTATMHKWFLHMDLPQSNEYSIRISQGQTANSSSPYFSIQSGPITSKTLALFFFGLLFFILMVTLIKEGLKPKWKSPNHSVRIAAVGKLSNQRILSIIAKHEQCTDIQVAAVEKLTDQALLADIAKNDRDWIVRRAAVKNLANQGVLTDIAKNDENEFVRKAAVEKLTDQAALAHVAKNDKEWDVKKAAKDKLTEIRKSEIEKLTDQAVLTDIVMKDENPDVRKAAQRKLFDWKMHITAVENPKLADQALLAHIVNNDSDKNMREIAVEKLTDQAVLSDIAKNDKDNDVRCAAVWKLTDQALLAQIAKKDGNYYVKEKAKNRLNHMDIRWCYKCSCFKSAREEVKAVYSMHTGYTANETYYKCNTCDSFCEGSSDFFG